MAGGAAGAVAPGGGASLLAGDPAGLRRELLRRVRDRMDARAQAGMQADRVRDAACLPKLRFCKIDDIFYSH